MKNHSKNFKLITSSLVMGLMFFNVGCFEKESDTEKKPRSQVQNTEEIDFPLNLEQELSFLKIKNGEECAADIDCAASDANLFAKEYEFKRGQLILRGPNLFSELQGAWLVNSHLNIITGINNRVTMSESVESEIHAYVKDATTHTLLKSGVNMDLERPFEHKLVFSNRLGLTNKTLGEPGFCNPIEVDNFVNNSSSALLPVGFELLSDHQDFGFNKEKNTFVAETVVLCGGFEVLNKVLHIEAKNLILFNTNISIKSDQDVASGLKIVADNLGYFGHNVIETNILNAKTEHKSGMAPTVDISISGSIDVIDSTFSNSNQNSINIFMSKEVTE